MQINIDLQVKIENKMQINIDLQVEIENKCK
jgi:hypothetical protein